MSFLSCFIQLRFYCKIYDVLQRTGHTFILFTIFFAEPSLPLIMVMFPNPLLGDGLGSQSQTLSLFHYWQTQIILDFPQNIYKSRSSEGAKQAFDK